MPQIPSLPYAFEEDINLKSIFDIIRPENNLVLADDMMLSDAKGIILRVSESYEKNFGFVHNSIVGRSAFDLEADGTFSPCVTAEVIRRRRKITATQTINHSHKNVMTVGIPLFDRSGELKFAVCFNTVSMEQINAIQRNYRHLQDSLQQYSQEIAELRTRATSTSLIFKSASMQRLWTLMQNTANTKANILITGETGVGKSAVAKAIHAMSSRADGPFIEVNCAVLHENLIESELFGYEKGAFTGAASGGKIGKIELANNGTLFLDEIGELPPHIQSKLLQLIQIFLKIIFLFIRQKCIRIPLLPDADLVLFEIVEHHVQLLIPQSQRGKLLPHLLLTDAVSLLSGNPPHPLQNPGKFKLLRRITAHAPPSSPFSSKLCVLSVCVLSVCVLSAFAN